MPVPRRPKIMVCSSVHGSDALLDQIYAALEGLGYHVWMSKKGTLPVFSRDNAFGNCLRAVEECDLFLGIITPFYGTGRESKGALSITHQEMLRAIELEKLRWFLAHTHVDFARQILKQYRFDAQGRADAGFNFKPTKVMDDIGVVEMYEAAIRNDVPDISQRFGNWVQPYTNWPDIARFLEAQFGDVQAVRKQLKERTP